MPNLKLVIALIGFACCCVLFPPLVLLPLAWLVLPFFRKTRAATDVHRFNRRIRKVKRLTR